MIHTVAQPDMRNPVEAQLQTFKTKATPAQTDCSTDRLAQTGCRRQDAEGTYGCTDRQRDPSEAPMGPSWPVVQTDYSTSIQ